MSSNEPFVSIIINYCEEKIPLGFLEGLNNKIRVISRRSYGFRDTEYFKLKILQRCSHACTY